MRGTPRTVPLAPLALPAFAALVTLVALGGCAPRRDVSELAAGLAPFDELRGLGFRGLRAGIVRAFRSRAERAPTEGFRERIGDFDVVYAVPGYEGADGAWPNEDALVEGVEASRAWPSDSAARAAFDDVVREYSTRSGSRPACYGISGGGQAERQAEWEVGDGFAFTVRYAIEGARGSEVVGPAFHSLAVRRRVLRDRLPATGAADAGGPTWQPLPCDE